MERGRWEARKDADTGVGPWRAQGTPHPPEAEQAAAQRVKREDTRLRCWG